MKTYLQKLKNYFPLVLITCITLQISMQEKLHAQSIEDHSTILNDLKFSQIEFKPRSIKQEKLHNSKLFLLEDTSLPFVSLTIIFPGNGIYFEPIERAGLFSTTLSLMEKGGAGQKSSDETSKALSSLGAHMSISKSQNSWQITLKVLTNNFSPAFQILSDTLTNPTLEKKIYNTIIQSSLSRIERRNQKPNSIAHRKLKEIMYRGDRLGYTLQKKDIKRISYKKVQQNIKNVIASNPPILSISGDIKNTQIRKKLSHLLKTLPSQIQKRSPIKFSPLTNKKLQKNIYLIEKDTPQSVILMSSFLPAKNNPDFYALQVGNYILGGGSFNSRLMKEIRVNRGLAYYAYSHNYFFKHYGRFLAGTATRVPKTKESFLLMKEIIHGMHNKTSLQELRLAKKSILNSLIFAFDSPEKRLSKEVAFFIQNMKSNYLKSFPKNIQKQNTTSIQNAYKNHIQSKNLFRVVVGPSSLKKELEKMGNVVILQPEDPIPLQ